MISRADVYHIVAATIPLYAAMVLAYISLKWWKLFTPDQCSGINKFVAKISIPLMSFQVVSRNNIYDMNLKLLSADIIQKFLAFVVFAIFAKLSSAGNLDWVITGISLSTLPNTLILGIPIIRAMYGDEAAVNLSQIVALQSLIWYNLLLILFELSAKKKPQESAPLEIADYQSEGEVEEQRDLQLKEQVEDEVNIQRPRKLKLLQASKKIWRKFIMNPNTHGTLAGIIWASIHFRWNLKMPTIVDRSISILADGGLGMAMFSLGLFMASQASIISCGKRKALLAMVLKFLFGPLLMAVSSITTGLRGTTFKMAVVQAALPQGIVPFVFAREYNIHPSIISTGVSIGLLIALPISLAYYSVLAL